MQEVDQMIVNVSGNTSFIDRLFYTLAYNTVVNLLSEAKVKVVWQQFTSCGGVNLSNRE